MRIRKVLLKNYRQFADNEIHFHENPRGDLHVIIGLMGTGKTNLLNAINWCLYDVEPYLSSDSQGLPVLNVRTIEDAEDGGREKVRVEIWTESNGRPVIFRREKEYSVHEGGQLPTCQDTRFEVIPTDEKGSMPILVHDAANSYVKRFVPPGIKEFFFFDGERLDNYFRYATGQKIRFGILQISQVSTLEAVKDKLETVRDDLRREAGKYNPTIEEKRENLETKEANFNELKKLLRDCEGDVETAKGEIQRLNEKLAHKEDVRELEEERHMLTKRKGEKEGLLGEKEREKRNLLFEYGKILMLYPSIEESARIIQDKRESREIPPNIDPVFVENIITTRHCTICGRDFDAGHEAEEHVSKLLREIELSSVIGSELMRMEAPLDGFRQKVRQFKANIHKITKDIQGVEGDLQDIEDRLREIGARITGHPEEKQIKEWFEQREKYERMLEDKLVQLGNLRTETHRAQTRVTEAEKALEKELGKEEKVGELKALMDFSTKAVNVAEQAKVAIVEKIRNQIESETARAFSELMWKKGTFKDPTIDATDNIHLVHVSGYDCLGTISGGEREVLALSFTIALHKISGFESPILIDRPLAMVSGAPRRNIVEILAKVATEKQIILLLTPDDYVGDVAKCLDEKASSRQKLSLSPDERVATVEVL